MIALECVALNACQQITLRGVFHTLGENLQTHTMAQCHDGLSERERMGVGMQITHE